jgi:ribonuclease III
VAGVRRTAQQSERTKGRTDVPASSAAPILPAEGGRPGFPEAPPELVTALGQTPSPLPSLPRALVHRSILNERPDLRELGSNERLEFLGDSVLDFVISDSLHTWLPDAAEGTLTAMRAAIVREAALAEVAAGFELGRHLLLGKGEAESGGRVRRRLLASGLEAIIGAIYLDLGLAEARAFVLRIMSDRVSKVLGGLPLKDAKSTLQEASQARSGLAPSYVLVSTEGPSHAPRFSVAVMLGDLMLGAGNGSSKQDAEEASARDALGRWDKLDLPSR